MQPLNVSMKSKLFTRPWHVQLYSVYGTGTTGEIARLELQHLGVDICSYTRRVLFGLLLAIVVAGTCAITTLGVTDTCAWIIAGLLYGFVAPAVAAQIFLFFCIAAVTLAVMIVIAVAGERLHTYIRGVEIPKTGLVGTAYSSFKDKFCVQLKFTDGDEK